MAHFNRSQKRRGGNGLRDNNMQWDFWSLNPESAHQVTYLMGDRGIPKTLRHMNGYGSHTYMWVNAAGVKHWVKYHFHSDQGVEGLPDADASRIAGEDAKTYRINPFDLTKVWPHSDYPLIKVGKMTLNRNPGSAPTRCCSAGRSPTPTRTATGSGRTTSSCRSTSTARRERQHLHPGRRDGVRAPG